MTTSFHHATPTLFHAEPRQQLSSCFLVGADRARDLQDGERRQAISKWAGGIGVHLSNIRADGSYPSTGRYSDGNAIDGFWMPPQDTSIRVADGMVHLPSGTMGSILYLSRPRKSRERRNEHGTYFTPHGSRYLYATSWEWRDVVADVSWRVSHLPYTQWWIWETLHTVRKEKKYKRQVKARDLFREIINSQIETGTPYLQRMLVIRNPISPILEPSVVLHLCAEIIEYSDSKEYAVWNLVTFLQNLSSKSMGWWYMIWPSWKGGGYYRRKSWQGDWYQSYRPPKPVFLTKNIDPLVLVFRDWPIPILWWVIALIVPKLILLIKISLKLFTMPPSPRVIDWQLIWGPIVVSRDRLFPKENFNLTYGVSHHLSPRIVGVDMIGRHSELHYARHSQQSTDCSDADSFNKSNSGSMNVLSLILPIFIWGELWGIYRCQQVPWINW